MAYNKKAAPVRVAAFFYIKGTYAGSGAPLGGAQELYQLLILAVSHSKAVLEVTNSELPVCT
ncbi:MAG: hypothetical protein JSS76_15250 [Bacteroidetes bacterium]|nr:hypothetical protein [Bacteroidota bacterium]